MSNAPKKVVELLKDPRAAEAMQWIAASVSPESTFIEALARYGRKLELELRKLVLEREANDLVTGKLLPYMAPPRNLMLGDALEMIARKEGIEEAARVERGAWRMLSATLAGRT